MQLSYDEIRERIAHALDRAAEAHDGGRYADLFGLYEEVDVPETWGEGDRFVKVGIALRFLDGWIDASNHDWLYYEGISREDWPRLARTIATALRSDREIPTPMVLRHFGLRDSVRDPSFLDRIARLFRRR